MPYTWQDNWAIIPNTPSGRENGRTHGVAETADGRVVVFHQAEDGLLVYDPEGNIIQATGGKRWLGAHGLTLVRREGEEEYLWLTDQDSSEVAKVNLDGEVLATLPAPDHPAYQGVDAKRFIPTWAAENPVNGDVWVADGYGASLLHRYDRAGDYQDSLDGTKGAGRFKEPHGVSIRQVPDGLELWVTDRANHRIQIFDAEGQFLRDSMTCHSPCCFDFREGLVVVPELFTGVKVLNADDASLVEDVGAHPSIKPHPGQWFPPAAPDGWPNLAGTKHVQPGVFNSPHGAAFCANGDILVVEWIIGGRITRLKYE